ncbi:MAG: hypothetical protein KF780_12715 [Sphingomonas sp.]|nr:hypothetical protein [Sphingomonas sp.]
MRHQTAIAALALLPALAACGGNAENPSAEEINRLATPDDGRAETEAVAPALNDAAAAPQDAAQAAPPVRGEPAAKPAAASRERPSPPRERPAPKQQPAPAEDPHAGHDMNNMSH